jgi:hypothetical protein
MKIQKKTKQIIIITIIAVSAFVLIAIFLSNKNKQTIKINNEISQENSEEISVDVKNIKSIRGKIVDINTGEIKIAVENEEDLVLEIPQKNVSFIKQEKKENGEFLNEEIGLFNLKKEQEADIQYNSQTKELIMIVINN